MIFHWIRFGTKIPPAKSSKHSQWKKKKKKKKRDLRRERGAPLTFAISVTIFSLWNFTRTHWAEQGTVSLCKRVRIIKRLQRSAYTYEKLGSLCEWKNQRERAREGEIGEKNFPDARKMSSTICASRCWEWDLRFRTSAPMQPGAACTRVYAPPLLPPPPPSVLESFASCREEELIRRYFCQSNAARATRRIFPLNDKEIWSDVNLQLFLQRRNSKDPDERGRSFPLLSPIEELITGYTR